MASPSHVAFRLLCHASRVGAIIGKSGVLIKTLQEATGARIRIVDAPPDSPDRVILVTAPAAANHAELSRAQEALLKVFDRVIDVAAETTGTEVGDRVVSCRLLADTSQVGAVIGKGGKVVEKIRMDTGCKIRVLNDALPACTAPSDEIIERHVNMVNGHQFICAVTFLNAKKGSFGEVTFKILCSNDRVGAIIGKGGSIVKALQNESGATISFGPSVDACEDRLVTITASENPELRYSPAQKAVDLVFSKSVEAAVEKGLDGSKKETHVTARLVVSSNHVGCLLGKGGAIVSEMRRVTGASIRIIGNDQVPKCVSDNDQMVQISGQFLNVQGALHNATGRLRDHLFISTQNSGGTRSLSSVLADTSSPGRLRDPLPVGGQPIVAVSHNLNRHSLPGLRAPQSVSSVWFSFPSFPYLMIKTVAGINSRGFNDVARGLTSRKGGSELVSGIKTAIVTNTTVQIVVPDKVIGSVYGENGSNLARLRQISGAKVIVHEPRLGTSDRTIVISGTPDETRAAQSLLQAFILTGSS
uniref:KH domain-containing protein At4g18375 family n=1 Tax=Cajanus cajan TaxID=3821 RepID=A0A151T2A7_CAJCA|nr:KH domain-containing protein At4g18375 family [Cajanus cajan]